MQWPGFHSTPYDYGINLMPNDGTLFANIIWWHGLALIELRLKHSKKDWYDVLVPTHVFWNVPHQVGILPFWSLLYCRSRFVVVHCLIVLFHLSVKQRGWGGGGGEEPSCYMFVPSKTVAHNVHWHIFVVVFQKQLKLHVLFWMLVFLQLQS